MFNAQRPHPLLHYIGRMCALGDSVSVLCTRVEKARGCAAQVLLNGEVIGVLERSNPRNLSLPNVFGRASANGDVRLNTLLFPEHRL